MTKFVIAIIVLLILYVIAFVSAKGYREDDAILGVNRHQWRGILVMWISVLLALAQQ